MTEAREATDPPTTLLGLGPPEPPEEPIDVALAKTDGRDTSVVTVRAWATSRSEYDALTSANDDDVDMLPLGLHPARRRRVFVALGAFAVLGALALSFMLRRPSAPRAAKREVTTLRVASSAPKMTALAGGPWVLRSGEASVESLGDVPDYLFFSAESSERPAPRSPSVEGSRPAVIGRSRAEANGRGSRVISDPAESAVTSDPGRIQAVADAVELEDDEGTPEAPSAAEPR